MLTKRSGRVREARKLRRRAAREKAGLFLAEGPQAVQEAISRPDVLVELFASPEAAERHAELLAAARDVPLHLADKDAVASLSETLTPQGLVAVCHVLTVPLAEALGSRPTLVAVLVEVRDPGNAGTVIRCADAAGADTVILAGDAVDPHGGKCVRASAGSLFHLPIASGVTVEQAVGGLRDHGLTVLAADGSASTNLDEALDTGMLARPTAWLFGNEARGLPAAALDLAEHAVRVPIYGRAESLNLAAAAAVCLYASARAQRR